MKCPRCKTKYVWTHEIGQTFGLPEKKLRDTGFEVCCHCGQILTRDVTIIMRKEKWREANKNELTSLRNDHFRAFRALLTLSYIFRCEDNPYREQRVSKKDGEDFSSLLGKL